MALLIFLSILISFTVAHTIPELSPDLDLDTRAVKCSPLELVISRGTVEPGIFGIIVGDPLYTATKKLIPNITGYAVPYPAGFDKYSEDQGIAKILAHFQTQTTACPDQKYVIVGYSQGGAISHYASVKLDPSLYPKIVAVVMFGDEGYKTNPKSPITGAPIPPFPAPLAQKLRENCQYGDVVCDDDGNNFFQHLSYWVPSLDYISNSALYIQKQFQSGGTSGPEVGGVVN